MKTKQTIVGLARKYCTTERKKKPHLFFFLDDPPCRHCMARARKKLRG